MFWTDANNNIINVVYKYEYHLKVVGDHNYIGYGEKDVRVVFLNDQYLKFYHHNKWGDLVLIENKANKFDGHVFINPTYIEPLSIEDVL